MRTFLSDIWNSLSIKSSNHPMEKSYRDFQSTVEQKLLSFNHIIAILIALTFLLFGLAFNVPSRLIYNRIIILAFLILTYLTCNKNSRIYKILLLSIKAIAVYLIMANIHVPSTGNLQAAFVIGNAVCLFEMTLLMSLKKTSERSLAYLLLTSVKFIMASGDVFMTSGRIFVIIPLPIMAIVATMYESCHDRKVYKEIYESREKLRKFQELLSNDFPLSVVIIDTNFQTIMYSNKFFKTTFEQEEDINVFKKLMLDSADSILQLDTNSTTATSVYDYIMNNRNSELIDQEHFMSIVNVRYQSRYFEIRFIKTTWNDQNAYAIIINDTSDKQTVMSLKLADEQKDKVIATVSHELRTPINGILGLIEMIAVRVTDSQALTYLENCKSCSKLLLYLVNSILNLSQLRHNKLIINKNFVNFDKFLEEIRSLYIYNCQQKDIRFIIEKESNVPSKIYTDQYKLTGILINLLSNAVKFTFKGFVVLRISVDEEDSQKVVFSIEDTGIGIHDRDKPQLFKMFGTIVQQNKNINSQGVGLGLTIASGLLEALTMENAKERIEFKSEFGKGTTFWFKLDVSYPQKNPLTSRGVSDNNVSCDVGDTYCDITQSPAINIKRCSAPQHHSSFNKLHKINLLFKKNQKSLSPQRRITSTNSSPMNKNVKKNILIVDDVPLNLVAATFILERLGFKVTKAFNGQEALDLLKNGEMYCLVLTDVQMPILDGIEMSKEIVKMIERGELYEIPVVCLTATKLDGYKRESYKRSGVAYALEKPLVQDEIKRILVNLNLL